MLLSEMFGVERYTDFGVKGYEPLIFNISTTPKGVDRLYFKDTDVCLIAGAEVLTDIIYGAPDNIIHLPPPLTNEQKEQLKAIWMLGGRWIAKDGTGNVFAYDSKPQKILICSHWNNDEEGECFTVMRELSVCSIVSWSDPEPLDIGNALGVTK